MKPYPEGPEQRLEALNVLTPVDDQRLLLVGNPDPIHVGAHFYNAAQSLGIPVELCDTRLAFAGSWIGRQLSWRLRGHRPPRLRAFGQEVLRQCHRQRPRWLLATGQAPLEASVLAQAHELGVLCLNYLTDDPWNPSQRASWFLEALSYYDVIFTPRRANMADLMRQGSRHVQYLPFAYAPEIHFRQAPAGETERREYACDILFYGGADSERLPYVEALLDNGFKISLYGGYWERYRRPRAYARGHAQPETLRKAVAGAAITLCLVRRANRDGHVMRTFEAPAMGGCMLVEETVEHRELLGPDGEMVRYFRSPAEMVERLRWLLDQDEKRRRLAAALHSAIVSGENTYRDRLRTMLASQPASREARAR